MYITGLIPVYILSAHARGTAKYIIYVQSMYSTAQVKEPKNSLFRISAFREVAKNTRNQTE